MNFLSSINKKKEEKKTIVKKYVPVKILIKISTKIISVFSNAKNFCNKKLLQTPQSA